MIDKMINTGDGAEFCTYTWAAELLGLSVRQINRYVRMGILTMVLPRLGKSESPRGRALIPVRDVLALQHARRAAGRG